MNEAYDIVVAGAGHNSLIAAAYPARAGFSCLILEAQDCIGGDTATEELTLPGFRQDSSSTAHNLSAATRRRRSPGRSRSSSGFGTAHERSARAADGTRQLAEVGSFRHLPAGAIGNRSTPRDC
jgi:phytoene dehydrogenase-like protein